MLTQIDTPAEQPKKTLWDDVADLLAKGENWDIGSFRGSLAAILERHIKGGRFIEDRVAAQTWGAYRAKVTKVFAAKHPTKEIFIVVAENGEVTVVPTQKFDTVFELDV